MFWSLEVVNVLVYAESWNLSITFTFFSTVLISGQYFHPVFINQMFGGSSSLPTTAERAVIKSNR